MQTRVWELIRMLATNKLVHSGLLPSGSEDPATFWSQTFNDRNAYMKIYKQEIIYDLMEKENIDEIRRIQWSFGYDKYYRNV